LALGDLAEGFLLGFELIDWAGFFMALPVADFASGFDFEEAVDAVFALAFEGLPDLLDFKGEVLSLFSFALATEVALTFDFTGNLAVDDDLVGLGLAWVFAVVLSFGFTFDFEIAVLDLVALDFGSRFVRAMVLPSP
jgi:hypothetical protein